MTNKVTRASLAASEKARKAKIKQLRAQATALRNASLEQQDELLTECQQRLRAPGVNFADVSRKAGVSSSTVAKFAYGRHHPGGTVRPAMTTVISIFRCLGYQIDKTGTPSPLPATSKRISAKTSPQPPTTPTPTSGLPKAASTIHRLQTRPRKR